MADSVVSSLHLLNEAMKQADADLAAYIKQWGTLGNGIRKAVEEGKGSIDDLMKHVQKGGSQGKLKFRLLTELTDEKGKPLSKEVVKQRMEKLSDELEKWTGKEFTIGGIKFSDKGSAQQALNEYKIMLQMLGKTAQEQYDIIQKLFAEPTKKNSTASAEWKESRRLANAEKKRAQEASDSYIQWTQRVQELNRELDKLNQKLTEQQNKQVGTDYKSEESKKNAIKRTNTEIEKTKKAIEEATIAQQKFAAAVTAISGGKKLNSLQAALGIEVTQVEGQVQQASTVIDRLVKQINEKAQRSGEQFAKQLVNTQAIKGEAQNAASQLRIEIQRIEQLANKGARAIRNATLAAMPSGSWGNLTGTPLTSFGVQNQVEAIQRHRALMDDAIKHAEAVRGRVFANEDMSGKTNARTEALKRLRDALAEINNLQERAAQSARQYEINAQRLEGVTRRYNDNEQALAKLQQRWEELNVKKQAGFINQTEFDKQTKKILDEYDKLIAKRKEFEVGDLGQMSSTRQSERVREQARLAREAAKERQRQAREAAKAAAKAHKDEKDAIQQQIKLQKQLSVLRKEYRALAAKNNRSDADNALLERTKKKIIELINLSKQLNQQHTGTHKIAVDATAYDRLKGKLQETNALLDKQKSGFDKLLPTIRRVGAAIGVSFSVQSLVQFGKKIIETTGRFEQQFVALRQIVGDTDKATKLWAQTLNQALQSPFRAMQLVDYTKKLAAYRIETEKLFDTTKRLADVSSGLGVDMGRIILAYGQVKTANFLRASEVRQFTEAGINIYGELAKYFTEIEGHAVTTADMVERVSKRMVLFSDVEEIFKRMTDEGGVFFDMQRVQSETVRGQVQKLHDAYEQMLNTIGSSNSGVILSLIERLNDLVKHWRDVWFYLKTVVVVGVPVLATFKLLTLGTQRLSISQLSLVKNLTLANTRWKGFNSIARRSGVWLESLAQKSKIAALSVRGLSRAFSLLKMAAPFIIIDIIARLVTALTESSRAAHQLREELNSIVADKTQDLDDEIERFSVLKEKLDAAAEGSQTRRDLIAEMNSKYGKYLDNLITESTSLENIAKAYEQVEARIRSYAQAQAMAQINERISKQSLDAQTTFVEKITGQSIKAKGHFIKLSKREAEDLVRLWAEAIFSGSNKSFNDILHEYFQSDDATLYSTNVTHTQKAVEKFKSDLDDLYKLQQKYEGLTFEQAASTHEQREAIEQNREAFKRAAKEEEELHEKNIKSINNERIEREVANKKIEEEEMRHQQVMADIRRRYNQPSETIIQSLVNYEKDYNRRLAQALGYDGTNSVLISRYNRLRSTPDNTQLGESQRDKQIADSWKQATENLKKLKSRKAAGGDVSIVENGITIKTAEKVIAEAEQEVKDWALAARLRGIDLTDNKKGGKIYKNFNDIISLVKTMHSEFDKLSNSAYGFAKSAAVIRKKYKKAFDDILGVNANNLLDWDAFDFTTKEGVEAALKQISDNLTVKGLWGLYSKDIRDLQNKMEKEIGTQGSEIGISIEVKMREDFTRTMERAFSDYELTVELDKLNVPTDFAEDLFSIKPTTLADIQNKLDEFVQKKGEKFSEQDMETYKKYVDKIEKEIDKQKRERVKQYSSFLEHEYSERAKIEMKYAQDRAFVIANFTDAAQMDLILQGLQKKYEQEINELTWKSFRESDFYVDMVNDLASLPVDYTKILLEEIDKILKNPEALSPKALKEALKARQQIIEAQMNLRPLQTFRGSLSEFRDFVRNPNNNIQSKTFAGAKKEAQARMKESTNRLITLNKEIAALQTAQGKVAEYEKALQALENQEKKFSDKLKEGLVTDESGSIDYGASIVLYETQLQEATVKLENLNNSTTELSASEKDEQLRLQRLIQDLRSYVSLLQERIRLENELNLKQKPEGEERSSEEIGQAISQKEGERDEEERNLTNWKKFLDSIKLTSEALKKFNADINTTMGEVKSAGAAFYDMFEALGGETDAVTQGWKEFGGTMLDTITQALTMIPMMVAGFTAAGIAINSALGIIGLIAEAVQLVVVAVTAVAKLHDSYYEREIEKQQKTIDRLKESYDELQESIANTLTSSDYMADYDAEMKNIQERIEATQNQIEAEREKKDTDQDKIDEYNKSIKELEKEAEEAKKDLQETFLGFNTDDFRSITEEFVSAWTDAYEETGDGFDAMMDNFQDKMKQWFIKQAVMRVAGAKLEPLLEQMVAAVDNDGKNGVAATQREIQDIMERAGLVFADLNDEMRTLYNMWGIGGNSELSGLAAGIQGMSEETADVLAGYWNSVRQYTASIDMNVSKLTQALSTTFNPMLSQVNLMAQNVRDINALLQATSTNNGQGRGFRVYSM